MLGPAVTPVPRREEVPPARRASAGSLRRSRAQGGKCRDAGGRVEGMAVARGVGGRLSPGSPLGGVASSACPRSALRLLKKQKPLRGHQVAVPPPGLSPRKGLYVPRCPWEGHTGQRVRPSAAVGLRILRGNRRSIASAHPG